MLKRFGIILLIDRTGRLSQGNGASAPGLAVRP